MSRKMICACGYYGIKGHKEKHGHTFMRESDKEVLHTKGCKGCGDSKIDNKYKCSSCLVQDKEFKWAVITKAEDKLGNQYDETKNMNAHPDKWITVKVQNFTIGEILMIDPWFGRELSGKGRKPSKWDVEYEVFAADDWHKAAKRAADLRSW
jgi:hypothetical protein